MDMQLSLMEMKRLIEHYYATQQLPTFLIGFVLGITVVLLVLRYIRRLDQTYQVMQTQVKELKSEAKAFAAENERLKNRAEDLERRNSELCGERKVYRDQIDEIARKLEIAEAATQRYKEAADESQEKLEEVWGTNADYSSQLDAIHNSDGKLWTKEPAIGAPKFKHLNQRRCPIISVVNLKGGVGKTHLTANLGATLAQAGHRVLLIDLDHQGSLTQLALNPDEDQDALKLGKTIHSILAEPSTTLALRCLTRCGEAVGELSLIGAHQSLGEVENRLMLRWAASDGIGEDVRYRLRGILHDTPFHEHFDFVLLDCPPRLTTSCINALAASDFALVPVLLEERTAETVPRMLQWLKSLKGTACPDLSLLGVVGNKAMNRPRLVQREQNVWDDLRDRCGQFWGHPVHLFDTIIREHTGIEGRFAALDSRLAPQYQDLTDLILKEMPHNAYRNLAHVSR